MVALRFRIDRNRDRTMTTLNLYNLPLNSYKLVDIREFVNRVRYAMTHLRNDELKDRQLLYSWRWDLKVGLLSLPRSNSLKKAETEANDAHGYTFGTL